MPARKFTRSQKKYKVWVFIESRGPNDEYGNEDPMDIVPDALHRSLEYGRNRGFVLGKRDAYGIADELVRIGEVLMSKILMGAEDKERGKRGDKGRGKRGDKG